MDYFEWFAQRLTALRMQKGVSARDMSLSLGQSESYINKIENRRTMPSMAGFFYICEYLDVTPAQFFDPKLENPEVDGALAAAVKKLSPKQAAHLLLLVEDLVEKHHC